MCRSASVECSEIFDLVRIGVCLFFGMHINDSILYQYEHKLQVMTVMIDAFDIHTCSHKLCELHLINGRLLVLEMHTFEKKS